VCLNDSRDFPTISRDFLIYLYVKTLEKEYNTALSRIRVKIENIIGDLKTFRILSDRYRNKRKRYGVKFNIIAGIVNLKNGFASV